MAKIGKYIATLLTSYVLLAIIVIMIKFIFNCLIKQCSPEYLSNILIALITLMIPAEVDIVNALLPFGALIVTAVLFYYWEYVKPHER